MMNQQFNRIFLESCAEKLRAISHPHRLAIIDLLHNNGQMTVTDIHNYLHIEQAVASHHLSILKNREVVSFQREGKNSLYQLTNNEYYEIIQMLTKVL